MSEITKKCKSKSNIFNDMRDILALDLTRNELKVLIAYRLEMDEETRQVRGKSQEELRALTGLGRSQFSEASGSLQRRGLIDAKRARNAPQSITVPSRMSGNQDIRETQTSGNPVIRDSGQPEIPDSGRPENPDDEIYTAPVTAPKSAPPRESEADRLHRQAYLAGLELKGGKSAKSARAVQRSIGELDGSRGIRLADGELTVDAETAAKIRHKFPGIDVAAVCNKAAAEVCRISYPTREVALSVIGKWAQIQLEHKRSVPTPKGEILPFKVTGVRHAKPREEVANA